ncbi:class I SAM-dependent DNA methyltransferase [Saccharothrix syringae]|nr:methyltransferase domain-containing protein [Saccharothrix syringae]
MDDLRQLYEQWAPFYDENAALRPFERHGGWFHELAQRYGAPGERLLDLGCGTGLSSLGFAALGYRVTGCDLSAAMLAVAEGKPGAERVRFRLADLRDLPDLGVHDVACAVTDPISHLLTDADLAAALAGVARSLVPGGVLVFDQVSERGYRCARERVVVDDRPGHFATCRTTRLAGDEPVFDSHWTRFLAAGDDRWRRVEQHAFFRYRPEPLLRRALAEAGLECVAVHGLRAGELRAGADDHADDALLYVARRP